MGVRLIALLVVSIPSVDPCSGEVLFSELMVHPASQDPREEFVEMWNTGVAGVDLRGWSVEGGISFLFNSRLELPPGGRVVIAADPARLRAIHGGLDGVQIEGPFTGALRNSGETLVLRDGRGREVDRVPYAAEGAWGIRQRGEIDRGHRGLVWSSPHDGGGASLELVQPGLPNDLGGNWLASTVTHGTPGRTNSVASTNIPPLIVDPSHTPAVPGAGDPVVVRARVLDEAPGVQVRLFHRLDGEAVFSVLPMGDGGVEGDLAAGDGWFSARLPARPAGSVVEFYIEARDEGGQGRTWPAPVLEDDHWEQSANALYQVDDPGDPADWLSLRLVLRASDAAELVQINRNRPPTPYPLVGEQAFSHSQFNATVVLREAGREQVRYRAGVRNRGNGSRSATPQSYRVNFPADHRWNGVSSLNLNTQVPDSQILGSAIFRVAGVPAARAQPGRVRVNGVEQARPGYPSFGVTSVNEVINSDFVRRQFPHNSGGNAYKAQRRDSPLLHANLDDLGEDPAAYRPIYSKETNAAEDDWRDLIDLARALTNAPDARYLGAVEPVLDVDQWCRYFALNALLANNETSPINGAGDDYFLYRGTADARFQILPYDLDTILGAGSPAGSPTEGIFRMIGDDVPAMERFLTHPEVVPRYFRELRRMARTVLAPSVFRPLAEHVLAGVTPPERVLAMESFAAARAAWVLTQIPESLSVTSSLPLVAGVALASTATVALGGAADPVMVRQILVNGSPAVWVPWQVHWSATGVPLRRGMNRLEIRALGDGGAELAHASLDVRFPGDGVVTAVSGTLTGSTRWTAAASPYRVQGTLILPTGSELVIEPGATVEMAAGAHFELRGLLRAEGLPGARIRFQAVPGTTNPPNFWAGFDFLGAGGTNRLAYVDIEHAGSGGHSIQITGGTLELEHCTFAGTTRTLVETHNASLLIRGCVFPTLSGNELIHGADIPDPGFLRIEGNVFGTTTGLNDIIDFSRARRPGPILEVRDNVFTGASDDVLDLDGCDAHIEGNIFLHVTNGDPAAPDTSSAISFGEDGGYGPHVVAVRNLFLDVDHVALCKEGGSITLAHNSAHGIRLAAVNFSEPLRGVKPGRGARLEENIFSGGAVLENRFPTNGTVELQAERNLSTGGDLLSEGPGNLVGDPRWMNPSVGGSDPRSVRSGLALEAGSPARGAGLAGVDLGADILPGPVVEGLGAPVSWRTQPVLRVVGPGLLTYQWRLDDGAWSAHVPLSQPLVPGVLNEGPHRLEVLALDSAQQESTDLPRVFAWQVDPAVAGLRWSEVLAAPAAGQTPFVELWNDGPDRIDAGGWTLQSAGGSVLALPAGSILEAGARMAWSTPAQPAGGGWECLDALGQNRLSMSFGNQAAGYSLAWDPQRGWELALPTPGTNNVRAVWGPPQAARLTEWLALGRDRFGEDFLEVSNPLDVPLDLGAVSITDNPIGNPFQVRLPPLSFLPPRAATAWIADGTAVPGHLAMRLDSSPSEIALTAPDGSLLDTVLYGIQVADRSEGRLTLGEDQYRVFEEPTPGGLNPSPGAEPVVTESVLPLVPWDAIWHYRDAAVAPPADWADPSFIDDSWARGAGTLAHLPSGTTLAEPVRTTLAFTSPLQPAFYFRTTFRLDGVTPGMRLRLSYLIDDGAIWYLNGFELNRFNLPPGVISHTTSPSSTVSTARVTGPIELSSDLLQEGTNHLAVAVHQSGTASSDIVFGMNLEAAVRMTNLVAREVLALDEVCVLPGSVGSEPDPGAPWLEIFNPGTNTLVLGGCSLTDDAMLPRRHVFVAGRVLAPGTRAKVVFSEPATDPEAVPVSGWRPSPSGGVLYLFDRPEAGGGLLDTVRFGPQLPGYSIGRVPSGNGPWSLIRPSPGSGNTAVPMGNAKAVRINEWMATPAVGPDWLELHNPGPDPVDLAGLTLSDDPFDPGKSRFGPLSFLGTGSAAFLQILVDGDRIRPGHAGFQLAREGEVLRLGAADGSPVDEVRFGVQLAGVSEGRFPDGSDVVMTFPAGATPGAANRILTPEDADGDGLPDAWELAHGLRTDSALGMDGALGDPDGDGFANRREWLAGTDPRDAASVLALGIRRAAAQMEVVFGCPADRACEVQSSQDPGSGAWDTVASFPAGPSARTERVGVGVDPVAPRFFRLRVTGP